MTPLVSLCIPTNGVSEWVFPVLDSIYAQGVDNSLFEVVVTDNGKNDEFKSRMRDYASSHSNLLYEETSASAFINEIEAYTRSHGELIKFVNHRARLRKGALQKFIDFVNNNREDKPIVYFGNGEINVPLALNEYSSFDEFVRRMSYFSSTSNGMIIWREDFEKLPKDPSVYNELFPHLDIMFSVRNRGRYLIDNTPVFDELPKGKVPKGRYDVFYAFCVEYPGFFFDLYRDKAISLETFRSVLDDNLSLWTSFYLMFCIRKRYCSYDLTGLKNVWGIFYRKNDLRKRLIWLLWRKVRRKDGILA